MEKAEHGHGSAEGNEIGDDGFAEGLLKQSPLVLAFVLVGEARDKDDRVGHGQGGRNNQQEPKGRDIRR